MKTDIVAQAKAELKASKKANKQPRTIKVKTVVISVLVTIALIASFIGGWQYRSADQARVNAEEIGRAHV